MDSGESLGVCHLQAAFHYLIRFVAAKALVGYGMDLMLTIFSICNGIVSNMASSMGGISQAMISLPGEIQTAIESVGCSSFARIAFCSSFAFVLPTRAFP